MRADAAGARTWLLGALALWALAFWVLGLAGLGGRIERLPEDPALLQRLPQPPAAAEERLGALEQYGSVGQRPLFTDNRRPQLFLINPEGEESPNTFDFILTSVLLTPRVELAILHPTAGGDPVRLRVGEAPEDAPAWSLVSLTPRSAVFAGPEGNNTLELRVFDGTGGEAPTVVSTPRPDAAGATPANAPGAAGPDNRPRTAAASAGGVPPPAAPPPAQVPAPTVAEETAKPLTAEAQVDAIRQRIEARRAQLRQQAQQPTPPRPAPAPARTP